MKKDKIIMLLIIIALLALAITIIAYPYWKIISVTKYQVKLSVGDRIGIDVDNDKISFGTMLQNSESSRTVEINNGMDIPVKVSIKQAGNTTRFVQLDEDNVILNSQEKKELSFIAKVPRGANYGNYTGEIIITVTRA